MLMRLMSKGKYLKIYPKGTKFMGSGKLGLKPEYKRKSNILDDNQSNTVGLFMISIWIYIESLKQMPNGAHSTVILW